MRRGPVALFAGLGFVMHAVGAQVAPQAVADTGSVVTQPNGKASKVALQLMQLREHTLERGRYMKSMTSPV